MTYLKLVSTLTAAAFIGGAFSATADTSGEKFAAMDVNADGLVSEAEFVAYVTADGKHSIEAARTKFAELAGDDASLTLEELTVAYETSDQKGGTGS